MTPRRGTRIGPTELAFTFDGRRYTGQRGDTAASALLAAGVRAFGRSVKARRLRGLVTCGPEEPSALLTVGTAPAVVPNLPAASILLHEGMALRSQNRWPSLHWDVASLLQASGGLFGAGFYYKTFFWPSWRFYEPLIRRLAGLGAAPGRSLLAPAAVEHCSCDVLVAGAGAAGLAAALAAARAGARVVLCEREPRCGGELEFEQGRIGGQPALDWIEAALAELARLGARVLTDATLVGGTDGEWVARHAPEQPSGAETLLRIRPKALVAALGAVERSIAFADNDRPGVMLQGAADRLLARYGVLPGSDIVLFGCHDRMYATATRLAAAGASVRAIVDTREQPLICADAATRKLRAALAAAGSACLAGHAVVGCDADGGAVAAVQVTAFRAPGDERTLPCDALLVSGGWSPELGLAPQDGWVAAGAALGLTDLPAVLADGHAAGERAARAAGAAGNAGHVPPGEGDAPPGLVPFWRSPAPRALERRMFVDLQNDVTVADLRQALAEGFEDIEHVKRYTALGMGTEQGRTSAALGAALLAEMKGEAPAGARLSRARPPLAPVPMNTLAGLRAGASYRAQRRTPLHECHRRDGARLDPMGLWLRPRDYRDAGADGAQAAIVEARRVRATGGIVDASTLGKIEFAGADAGAFLDTMYLARPSRIPVGQARYMVNLREDGMVLDDGIVLRLSDEHFLATTGSSHAEHMLSHFEHHRDLHWPGRAVTVTDVTEAWAVIAVAGPQSRAALCSVLGADWQGAVAGLGYMAFADGRFADSALRVVRAGYSGELAYELHVRPQAAAALWQALQAAGLRPYGIDALDLLRLEKGYLGASEINGQTTPQDLGLDAMLKAGNPCLGRALLDRQAFAEAARPRLVGVQAPPGSVLRAGAQLTATPAGSIPCGYVTSAGFSPALERWIGLALVARDQAANGAALVARDPLRGADVTVRTVPPVQFDPDGERIKS